jgi:hypothetical protein
MDGPTYHPSMACALQVLRTFERTCANIFTPGGAIGVRLKSYRPLSCSHADSLGLMRDPRKRFMVSSPCGNVSHHSDNGHAGSQLHKPATKWFLPVRMALSHGLRLWSCGGTSWWSISRDFMNSLNCSEHSLSKRWSLGLQPPSRSSWWMGAYASTRVFAFLFLTGR